MRYSTETRFWSKVDRCGIDDCWRWLASIGYHGYGRFRLGTWQYAHRVSWILTNGDIPDSKHILHKCNNPVCVNPKHLYAGSRCDNMHDALIAGTLCGHPSFKKLNANIWEEILDKYLGGQIQKDLAKEYGVTQSSISWIVTRPRLLGKEETYE